MDNTKTIFAMLVSINTSNSDFPNLQKINITSKNFTIGRNLDNSVVIPYLSISRKHCELKMNEGEWFIEDHSSFGVEVNGVKIGKGKCKNLIDDDVLKLEPSGIFVYKFHSNYENDYVIPVKRMKLEMGNSNNIGDIVKIKFEESQNLEVNIMADKIENLKQMQTTSHILKQQLELDMDRKTQQLETKYRIQIQNLRGEKEEVEKQKCLLLKERDEQLVSLKKEMEDKIADLMEQIKNHNEIETKLINENNLLKENMQREREEFLTELDRENSSKQEMLEKLEMKIKEQEEIRVKEKQELKELLRIETEKLKQAKDKEIKEIEEQKLIKEMELKRELELMKRNMQEQMEATEQAKLKMEEVLNEQIEEMKKLNNEDKSKVEYFAKEREECLKKIADIEVNSKQVIEKLKNHVAEKEIEFATLASERIEKQAEQSTMVIMSLQEQLDKMKTQLQNVESEKNTLLEAIAQAAPSTEGSSKNEALAEVGLLMENELQCSICAELFVQATTLNCSHTFCKYCITKWKTKKKECPNCRTPITSECKSLALDTFIEKMVENLNIEMKEKRAELLTYREQMESKLRNLSPKSNSSRRSDSDDAEDEEIYVGEYSEEDEAEYDDTPSDSRSENTADDTTDSNSRSDDDEPPSQYWFSDHSTGDTTSSASAELPTTETELDTGHAGQHIPGIPGQYYGGYGHCYNCNATGHWANGCPFR